MAATAESKRALIEYELALYEEPQASRWTQHWKELRDWFIERPAKREEYLQLFARPYPWPLTNTAVHAHFQNAVDEMLDEKQGPLRPTYTLFYGYESPRVSVPCFHAFLRNAVSAPATPLSESMTESLSRAGTPPPELS